jgi:hypothetical protein
LIVDFWHPDLSDAEVKFFSTIQKAKIRAEKQLTVDEEDTFYSVIDRAKGILDETNTWWTLTAEDTSAVEAALTEPS